MDVSRLDRIVAVGLYQANGFRCRNRRDARTAPSGPRTGRRSCSVETLDGQRLLLGDLARRPLFRGREWAIAGEEKIRGGEFGSGESVKGYWERAVAIPEPPGRPAITYDWYRDLLQYMLDNEWYTWIADVIMWGELLVGWR